MTFHGRSFGARFGAMGDEAEAVFEATYGQGFVRTGLNRPPISMAALATRVRYTPDYLTSSGYVEVKGTGRDQILKLKVENLNALHFWNQVMECRLWIWNTTRSVWGHCTIKELQKRIDDPAGGVTLDHFHDGKAYFAIPIDSVIDEWNAYHPDADLAVAA